MQKSSRFDNFKSTPEASNWKLKFVRSSSDTAEKDTINVKRVRYFSDPLETSDPVKDEVGKTHHKHRSNLPSTLNYRHLREDLDNEEENIGFKPTCVEESKSLPDKETSAIVVWSQDTPVPHPTSKDRLIDMLMSPEEMELRRALNEDFQLTYEVESDGLDEIDYFEKVHGKSPIKSLVIPPVEEVSQDSVEEVKDQLIIQEIWEDLVAEIISKVEENRLTHLTEEESKFRYQLEQIEQQRTKLRLKHKSEVQDKEAVLYDLSMQLEKVKLAEELKEEESNKFMQIHKTKLLETYNVQQHKDRLKQLHQSKIEQMNKGLEEAEANFQKQITELSTELEKKTKELKAHEDIKSQLEDEIRKLQESRQQLSQETNNLIEDMRAKTKQKESELQAFHEEFRLKKEDLLKEKRDLQRELRERKEHLENLTTQNKKILDELVECNRGLENQIVVLEDHISMLKITQKEEIEALKSRINKTNFKLEESISQIKSLKRQNLKLEEEIEKNENKISQQDCTIVKIESELKSKTSDFDMILHSTMQSAKKDYEAEKYKLQKQLEKEEADHNNKLNSRTQELKHAQEVNRRLRVSLEKLTYSNSLKLKVIGGMLLVCLCMYLVGRL